ncbi:TonB-dependent receptor [Adhaeribacter soli]|uniref:TonB-dependent receptor plug domain-containing protein n=1 Tax=Adhaeribacter soli TaxID=2607655 RepID=A0A5N1J2A7_9BACT|nr:TonB-dependent receptor [Adhaeribacter soli]KAA9340662.1 TonB-dependent receptor plug domain-containing protein [Adhaeribacter soli]
MKQKSFFSKATHIRDYFAGWEKAQQEYRLQFETNARKTVTKSPKNPKALVAVACLLFLIFPFQLRAQSLTQTIRGRIIDRESQSPVIGASVAVTTTNPMKGTLTDLDGNFRIEKVPVGRHTLKVNYIGYEEQVISELLLGSGKELVLSIGLTETFKEMDEVVVRAKQEKGQPLNEMATLSARSISVEETKRYAASVNDPARAALNYAGVASVDDGGNEIVVRGNSPKGVLWRMEGVEIPNPSHFGQEGASGGGVSILSVNMLDNSDFYTGAFPAEYGNALSGIFDMKLRKGNNEKREYAFQAGVLGVDFAAEGPFKEGGKGSYLANYRYSTLAILNKIGVKIAGDAAPDFQDLAFKMHLPTAKAGTFSVWGLGGYSSQVAEAERDASKWVEKRDRFDDVFRAGMGAAGLSHVYFVNPNAYLETVLSLSGNFNKYYYDSIGTDFKATTFYQEEFRNTSARVSTLYNHKLSNQHTIRFGAIYSRLGFDLFSEGRNEDKVFQRYMDNDGATGIVQTYGQWKYRILENVTLNSGLHVIRLGLNGNTSVEPRLGLRWNFSSTQALGAAFGVHSRHESMAVYFARQPLANGQYSQFNKNLELTKARHFVLSYDQMLREDLRFKAETYYQQLYDVAIGADPKSSFAALNAEDGFITDSLVSQGTGRNYGLELSLEKFFTNNIYFLITSSLYNSRYTAADGIERNTRFNGNHILNVVGGKEFKVGAEKTNQIGANIRLLWAGGNRYTPIDQEKSIQEGHAVYLEKESYAKQAEDYFRTDIRVSYRKNKPRASYVLSLDIQNVTNRLNVYRQFYDQDLKEVKTITQTGLIPVLNYRIEF